MRQGIATFVGVVALALLLSACGGGVPAGLQLPQPNFCGGVAYMLKSPAGTTGTVCGGIVESPVHVRLRRGEHFEVYAGAYNSTTHYPALQAHGAAIKPTSKQDSLVWYLAARSGSATLVAKARYCQKPVNGQCVAFVLSIS